MQTPKENILKWFTGKAREKAAVALDNLLKSEEEGSWIPKASRSVPSAFNKCNVAHKAARKMTMDSLDWEDSHRDIGWTACHIMRFGHITPLVRFDIEALTELESDFPEDVAQFRDYYSSFIEAAKLMVTLDNTKPKPVFTYLGVSPTVTRTLEDCQLDLDINTVRVCPIEFFKVEVKPGKWELHSRLLWPEGTRHNESRFASNFTHCHACGHAIRNAGNWVPIIIDDKDGVPHSMWLGKDCTKNIFGIKVKGNIVVEGGKQ